MPPGTTVRTRGAGPHRAAPRIVAGRRRVSARIPREIARRTHRPTAEIVLPGRVRARTTAPRAAATSLIPTTAGRINRRNATRRPTTTDAATVRRHNSARTPRHRGLTPRLAAATAAGHGRVAGVARRGLAVVARTVEAVPTAVVAEGIRTAKTSFIAAFSQGPSPKMGLFFFE